MLYFDYNQQMRRENTWSYSANRYKEMMEFPLRGFSKCFNIKKIKEYITIPEGKKVNVDRIIGKREEQVQKKSTREMNELLRSGPFMKVMKIADQCIFTRKIYSRIGKEKSWEEFNETTQFLKEMERNLSKMLSDLRSRQRKRRLK